MPPEIISTSQYLSLIRWSEALQSDPERTPEEVIWGKKVLSGYDLTMDQTAWILLLLHRKTTTGRLAFIFNRDMNKALRDHSRRDIDKILQRPQGIPEILENPYLTVREKKLVQSLVEREYQSFKEAITLHTKTVPFSSCSQEKVDYDPETHSIRSSTLISGCFSKVCLHHGLLSSPVSVGVVYLIDRDEEGYPHRYCIDLEELWSELLKDEPLNPKTGKPFGESVRIKLGEKFGIHKKIYQRSLEL